MNGAVWAPAPIPAPPRRTATGWATAALVALALLMALIGVQLPGRTAPCDPGYCPQATGAEQLRDVRSLILVGLAIDAVVLVAGLALRRRQPQVVAIVTWIAVAFTIGGTLAAMVLAALGPAFTASA